jgi:hypothetical protein
VRRPGGDGSGPADASPADAGLLGPDPFGPDFFGRDPLGGHPSGPGPSCNGQGNGSAEEADGAGTREAPRADRPRSGGRHAGGFAGDRARIVRRAVPQPATAGDDAAADGRYVAPPPEPLPQLDPIAKGAWAGLLGGPVYLVVASLLGDISDWGALLAIVAFIAGGVTLFLRMSDRPRDDDDDGAVV